MNPPVYLDHNATTPVAPEVVQAMLPYLREHFGNPSSAHPYGRRAKTAIERARASVAALLGADAEQIVFTSGGTEANNLAIFGCTRGKPRGRIVTSIIEHPSVMQPCTRLAEEGWQVIACGVDSAGRVRMDEARAVLPTATLLTVMHANNETGVVQPMQELVDEAKKHGALVHTDASQSVGKVPVDLRELEVDLCAIAGHKLYAPKGVGALFVRDRATLAPYMLGAGHEHGVRPGTENVAAIVGLGTAAALAATELEAAGMRIRVLRDALWALLRTGVPGIELNGHDQERLPNTLSVRFPSVPGPVLLQATPEIAASTGSACHEGVDRPSDVIVAMGVPKEQALGTVRLTLGRSTTTQDIQLASAALISAWRALTSSRTS